MRRREFVAGIAGTAVWPLASNAQQQSINVAKIGFLGASTRAAWSDWAAAFVSRLHEVGWVEGRNVAIEYRWGDGRVQKFAEIAAEFVDLKVDVIVTGGSAVPAVKAATSVIPIVFAIAGDPVAGGLVASLARPGGNVTGLSIQRTDLAPKELELFREIVPGFRRLAILANAGYREAVIEMHEASAAAQKQGVEVKTLQVLKAAEIGPALDTVRGWCD